MPKKILKLFLIPAVLLLFVSCSDVKVSITEDTLHEESPVATESAYLVGPGDILQITYFFGTQPIEQEYTLEVGDIIEVQFYYHAEVNRTATIHPDGNISLARKGEIRAAGLTTQELQEKISNLYSDVFKDPLVNITLIEFNQALKGFKEAITSDRQGHSKMILVRPDGYISLFHIKKDILASGSTLPQLQTLVAQKYQKHFDSLAVSLALETTGSNLVYVNGEVRSPDSYQLIQPTTVSQILSRAGIIWENAALSSIILISRSSEGKPVGRVVDMNKIIGKGNIGNDILLKRFDIVYVPKNTITKANIFVLQYIDNMLPENVRLTFGYGLGGKDDIFD
jgi:polysaccharide export outer membrane protein